jgi:hypothetical protein
MTFPDRNTIIVALRAFALWSGSKAAINLLRQDRRQRLQKLADEAFRDLLAKITDRQARRRSGARALPRQSRKCLKAEGRGGHRPVLSGVGLQSAVTQGYQ